LIERETICARWIAIAESTGKIAFVGEPDAKRETVSEAFAAGIDVHVHTTLNLVAPMGGFS
jgi:hypothetical protein